MTYTDPQLRLVAAKVLDEGPYKHKDKWVIDGKSMQCQKCKRIERSFDHLGVPTHFINDYDCPIPDLPEDELEVLAFRCRDKICSTMHPNEYINQLIKVREGVALPLATATQMIIAAGMAKGIKIERESK